MACKSWHQFEFSLGEIRVLSRLEVIPGIVLRLNLTGLSIMSIVKPMCPSIAVALIIRAKECVLTPLFPLSPQDKYSRGLGALMDTKPHSICM